MAPGAAALGAGPLVPGSAPAPPGRCESRSLGPTLMRPAGKSMQARDPPAKRLHECTGTSAHPAPPGRPPLQTKAEMMATWQTIFKENYHKSLDHRSFYFKQAEKKNLTRECAGGGGGRHARRASGTAHVGGRPLTRWQT